MGNKENRSISVHRVTPHLKPKERGGNIENFFNTIFPIILKNDLGGYEGCNYDLKTDTLEVFLTKEKN